MDLKLHFKIATLSNSFKHEIWDFIQSRMKRHKSDKKKKRVFGYARDSVKMASDFDAPLDDFKDY